MTQLKKEDIKKSIKIVYEDDKMYKVYTYPWRKTIKLADGTDKSYWAICRKKVHIKDPTRRAGRQKLTRNKVLDLLKSMPEEDVQKVFEFTEHLSRKHLVE